MKYYQVIVIGGGAGGITVAAGASSLGAKVALIEKEPMPGGDCLHTGCVPTKSLVHSAKIVHATRLASEFGIISSGELSFGEANNRWNAAIQSIQKHDAPQRFRALGVDVYQGLASFLDTYRVRIGSDVTLAGKRIVIATGSRPLLPPNPGLAEAGCLTNETVVMGGGPIGLEFAQSFRRFGAEVTVVEMAPEILIKEDRELVPFVR